MITCPACRESTVVERVYEKSGVPAINNRVYLTAKEAAAAPIGRIELGSCLSCDFVFNAAFDERLAEYTEEYNAARSHSPTFSTYLDSVVDICSEGLVQGTCVLEIGCGDGSFLEKLYNLTGAFCDGYDVSASQRPTGSGLRFHQKIFKPEVDGAEYEFLALRHVLEHIPAPRAFLEKLLAADTLAKGGQIYIEVPDVGWILENATFFDITYEHCNYFCRASLNQLLESLGFINIRIQNVFDGQYLMLRGVYDPDIAVERRTEVAASHNDFTPLHEHRKKWIEFIRSMPYVSIWGASGKGAILLSDLDKSTREHIRLVIDTNSRKQGFFLPTSAKLVEAPEALRGVEPPQTVLVMNPIYESEIQDTLAALEVYCRTVVIGKNSH